MSNNEKNKSNHDRYIERLRNKYPDKEFLDEEALFGQINDDYDAYDKEISDYKDREKALSDLFRSDRRSAAFLNDWRNGADPVVELVRKFGDDFKEALDDPDKQEALAAANKEYAERLAKEDEFEKQYQENIQETLSTIEQVQKEDGMSDDDVDKAMDFLLLIMRDGILGKFSADSIRMAVKALHHDDDVENADHEGEIRGRNAKIEEKLRKKNSKGDGTANLAGRNDGVKASRERPELGAINRYNDGMKNIWERGGEKRKHINQ